MHNIFCKVNLYARSNVKVPAVAQRTPWSVQSAGNLPCVSLFATQAIVNSFPIVSLTVITLNISLRVDMRQKTAETRE